MKTPARRRYSPADLPGAGWRVIARAGAALTRQARAWLDSVRACRAVRGGLRYVHQRALAEHLDCSVRQVRRYQAECVAAGLVEVTPPLRKRQADGTWLTRGSNGYRLLVVTPPSPSTGRTQVAPRPSYLRAKAAAKRAGRPSAPARACDRNITAELAEEIRLLNANWKPPAGFLGDGA